MSQVNVNTPGEPEGSSGSGFIIGVVVAVLVIAALVYFLVLNPGNGGNNGGDGGDGGNGGGESQGDVIESIAPDASVAPSGWVLVDHVA
jgi:hypothetical protein